MSNDIFTFKFIHADRILPGNDRDVLFYSTTDKFQIGFYDPKTLKWYSSHEVVKDVTYWSELPKEPRE